MRIKGKTVQKTYLPKKLCPICKRSFTWRKKWSRCWSAVVYCSERCRQNK